MVLQATLDVVNREVLFAQGHGLFAHRVAFRCSVGAFLWGEEKPALRVMPKLVAQDAEAAGGITEAFGGFGGRELFHEEGSQGFVLAVSGVGGFQESTDHWYYLFLFID